MRQIKSTLLAVLRKRWVFRLIGIGVLVLILLKIDLREAWSTLKTVNPLLLVLSLVLQAIGLFVATIRWQSIMRRLEIYAPFSRSLLQQLIGTAAALVTPGQLGEFIKVFYHRQEGFPVPESLLSVLIDRVYDLLMLLLFGFIAMAVLVGIPPAWAALVAVGGSIVVVLGFLFARNHQESANQIARVLERISPQAHKESMATSAHRLARRIGEFELRSLLTWGLLTVINYLFLLFRIYALFLAARVQVPFWYFAMVVPLLRLVGLIPISISGIGTRDITAIYLLGKVGVPEESALIVSMLGLITVQVQALVGLLIWWQYPLSLGREGPSLSEHPLPRDKAATAPGK